MRSVTTAILLAVIVAMASGCDRVLPVNPQRHTGVEREALGIAKALRASMAEVEASGADAKARTVAGLCEQLRSLRNASQAPRLVALVDALPAAWFDPSRTIPGFYGGYRFVLIRGAERGVYALPDPIGPEARSVFYARLPAGLYQRTAEGFSAEASRQAPEMQNDAAWRPVPVVK